VKIIKVRMLSRKYSYMDGKKNWDSSSVTIQYVGSLINIGTNIVYELGCKILFLVTMMSHDKDIFCQVI